MNSSFWRATCKMQVKITMIISWWWQILQFLASSLPYPENKNYLHPFKYWNVGKKGKNILDLQSDHSYEQGNEGECAGQDAMRWWRFFTSLSVLNLSQKHFFFTLQIDPFCWLYVLNNIWKITWNLPVYLICVSYTSLIIVVAFRNLLTRTTHQMDRWEWANGSAVYCRWKASALLALFN